MKRLILIRHGQTDLNKQRRYCGQNDAPLNDTGIWQAAETGAELACEEIDIMYTSDLPRASRTADIISGHCKCDVVQSAELRELDFGKFDSMTYEELMELYPDVYRDWLLDPVNKVPPEGEPLDSMRRRVEGFIEFLYKHHAEQTVAVVTHGGPLKVIKIFLGLAVDEDFWKIGHGHGEYEIIQLC